MISLLIFAERSASLAPLVLKIRSLSRSVIADI